MRVLGMISGTSHDGIDIAVVDFADDADGVTAAIEYTTSTPYSPGLRERLRAALPPAPVGFDVACELDTLIGQEFGAAAAAAVRAHGQAGFGPVDLVCSHGQTVFHWIADGRALGTLQLGQPAWIAEATGLPVLSDLRAADIAAGGQGAPLVPILDTILLTADAEEGRRAGALNLGGISNVTVVASGEEPAAWDIGPANALIDAVVTADAGTPDGFDRDGRLAAAGTVDDELLEQLLAEPYYALPTPKSTGKELFHFDYVLEHLARRGADLALADVVATLTELTARTVADAVRAAGVESLLVSGGGVRNPVLLGRIAELLPEVQVRTSDAVGVPSDDKEAVAFALIGWASASGLPGNVPSCTGASGGRVLGRLSPAPGTPLPSTGVREAWPRVTFRASEGAAG
ncbi:anhydro-N-acetylmuramic acid kinase [Leifsonia virtsii]|uniref:Anhydro-N-acetylmuramic acid kinase n=1 Tax=Leifsonia virtsii TaxID=3035915 RepID=A0ABT8J2L5_9MICO|nr:anhydro-N-acetylmuramic acid kinase [Leifsonia virtsii]MDN4599212.1 anhydro-N-acetylmuramic acid kinase [Leifsonia virtsii]